MKNIVIIGTGYVGIVSGVCLADSGNNVICIDKNPKIISLLQSGQSHIYEPGLSDLLVKNIKDKRIQFNSSLDEVLKVMHPDIIVIAVGTPSSKDGSTDLSYVKSVSNEIGYSIAKNQITKNVIIMNKSTVPVGTSEVIYDIIIDAYYSARENLSIDDLGRPNINIEVVSCPEFLREGSAIEDFMKSDRIVIGCKTEYSKKELTELFLPFVRNQDQIIIMDSRSSEMTKYAANAMIATKISFMNELSNLCEKTGADIELIRKGIGTDHRIGPYNIYPGCSFGGSCFSKDLKSLAFISKDNGYYPNLVEAVLYVNYEQRRIFAHRVLEYIRRLSKEDVIISVWGLAFKPKTDDIRDAPSVDILQRILLGADTFNVHFRLYDPIEKTYENFKREIKEFNDEFISYETDQYQGLKKSDVLLIFTESMAFKNPDFSLMNSLMSSQVIFDGRNLYEREKMKNLGFIYHSIGRKTLE